MLQLIIIIATSEFLVHLKNDVSYIVSFFFENLS